MMGFGFLLFIIFLVGIVISAILLGRYVITNQSPLANFNVKEKQKTAKDILAERYARGEITKAEFESMKADID